MRSCFYVALIFALMFSHAKSFASELSVEQAINACATVEWCEFVAAPSAFSKTTGNRDVIPLQIKRISLSLPRTLTRLDIFDPPLVSIKLGAHRAHISVVDFSNIQALAEKEKCAISPKAFWDLIFTKDLRSPPPATLCLQSAWLAAAMSKSAITYQGAHNAKTYAINGVFLYTVETTSAPFKRISIAVQEGLDDRYLQIMDDGLEESEILNILASVAFDPAKDR